MTAPVIVHDEQRISAQALASRPHAAIPGLADLLPYLASPDTGKALSLDASGESLTDGVHRYPLVQSLPLLLPSRLARYFSGHLIVPHEAATDAFMKYFLMGSLRHQGAINAPSEDLHFERHLHRMSHFVRACEGVVLDVGCDDASVGASLFSEGVQYVGLDPFSSHAQPFRVIGIGEFLPFRSQSVDCVVFNTSLDHIFDWHRAVEEARRVLKPGGQMVIASLVWTDRADLLGDDVHFHHFRDYEILGALADFRIDDEARYDYKGNSHRHGMYLRATRQAR